VYTTANPTTRVYRSNVDAWLAVVLGVTIVGMVVGAIASLLAPGSVLGRLTAALLLLASSGFVVWLVFGTTYTIAEKVLLIRSGPFRWTVPLAAITAVTPTRNPLSSPALSLDRLKVRYRGSRFGVMISPASRTEFLGDLAARAPGLRLDGDRLVHDEV
jgi:hypothetical protein